MQKSRILEKDSDDSSDSLDEEWSVGKDEDLLCNEGTTSDSEFWSESGEEEEPLQWNCIHTFETEEAVQDFLSNENCWSTRGTQQLKSGFKRILRCKLVPAKDPDPCEAAMYILQSSVFIETTSDDGAVEIKDKMVLHVYRNNRVHTHDRNKSKKVNFDKSVIDKVIDLHKDGKKPQRIIYILRADSSIPQEQQPPRDYIKNWIQKYEREQYSAKPFTMRDLTKFVEENNKTPEDEDAAFIIAFERSPPSQKMNRFFRFFITTTRLLRLAANTTICHADATHKVAREKVRLIVVGATDAIKAFHMFGIAGDEYAPKFLVSDADPAIHEAARREFGSEINIVMCYAHVMQNVKFKYKFKDSKANKAKFLDDLRILHRSPDEDSFQKGCQLFVKKWICFEEEVTNKLEKSFFKKNKNWFIGSFYRVPKTNNGLERCNGTIKLFQTEYKRPLPKFTITKICKTCAPNC